MFIGPALEMRKLQTKKTNKTSMTTQNFGPVGVGIKEEGEEVRR